ncbi:hypothetical protein TRSC58_07412 [Trypanosoma rangeli SC58]|uniref:Uncharacterized protein n=1 Tax=Trypanosoma rangeli SC58 TaxID=429131 RepID=A0A061IT96_TRYRA|nr:hypothetical protein TRSC58_07412 [Trypanosoma rangeli SC58]
MNSNACLKYLPQEGWGVGWGRRNKERKRIKLSAVQKKKTDGTAAYGKKHTIENNNNNRQLQRHLKKLIKND